MPLDPADVLIGIGVGALWHKLATDQMHQQQLQGAFDQGRTYERRQIVWEIQRRDTLIQAKDAEIARLREVVENQTRVLPAAIEEGIRKALVGQAVKRALPIAHPGFDTLNGWNGNGGPHG